MRSIIVFMFVLFSLFLYSQSNLESKEGRFNGSMLYIHKNDSIRINKGYANFQFGVKIDNQTRFPIASMTKLFTTVAILQLQEKNLVHLDDNVGKYMRELPENCKNITIKELLLHYSGLENEPISAVVNPYSIDEYIKNFVQKSMNKEKTFNYNNVDYVLLSKVIGVITGKSYSESINELILRPLNLKDTGFVVEKEVIMNLAYGYHNYSFGEGDKNKPVYNDRRFISNYYGAGAMYSTIEDIYQFVLALKSDKLLSKYTKSNYLLKAQTDQQIDWLLGRPTYGFFVSDDNRMYRRGGSIDGFNSELLISKDCDEILIILCNTDTVDLPKLATRLFTMK